MIVHLCVFVHYAHIITCIGAPVLPGETFFDGAVRRAAV